MRQSERGFTMIEVLIAVLLTVIAIIGIIALFMTETRASAYSRRATEATALATDKLEKLRTLQTPTAGTATGIDAQGQTGGMFDRVWTVTDMTNYYDIKINVGWDDDNAETTSCSADTGCTSGMCRPSGYCATRAVVVHGRVNK